MKKLSFLFLLGVLTITAAAQPAIQWQNSYGGASDDIASDIQQTPDGGYILAGTTSSLAGDVTGIHGGLDYWIVKLSPTGSIQWQKALGGTSNESAKAILVLPGGGYIVAGYATSTDGDVTGNHGYSDCWIVCLSPTGSIVWTKSLGGSNSDEATSIQQTVDGGYIVAGTSGSHDGDATFNHGMTDYWVVKLSSTGSIQWQRSYGGSNIDWPTSIRQTSDSGYIVAGWSTSSDGDVTGHHDEGSQDYWIVKLSPAGVILWERSFGGNSYSLAYAVQQTVDSGYIVAGSSGANNGDVTGNHGSNDYWILKLSPSGNILWQKTFGGSYTEAAYSIQQTVDNGYIVAGFTGCVDGDVTGKHLGYDYWLIKISPTGILQWEKCLGGSGDDYARSIRQTSDGGYAVIGMSNVNDGDVTGNHGLYDYWVLKLAAETGIPVISPIHTITVSPNPTTGEVTIKGIDKCTITVYNCIGQLVKEVTNATDFSLGEVPAGLYIARVCSEDGVLVYTTRIMKE